MRGRPSSGGGGGGADPGGPGLRAAINLGGIAAYGGCNFFIDKVKQTFDLWSGLARNNAALDANHFPANLAIGQSVTLPIWYGGNEIRQTQKNKPGAWKVTWDPTNGGGCPVTVNGDGISAIVPGTAGVATFTATGTSDNLSVIVTNSTGFAGRGITNLKVFHTAYEAQLLAGEVFDPDFIAQLTQFTYARFVRFLDWQWGNVGSQIDTDTLTPFAYQTWGRNEWGIPPELVGLMAKKLREVLGREVEMHTVMPRQATDAYMSAFFTRAKAADPSGAWPVRSEGANEPWNSGFPVYNYFGLTYYSTNSLTVYNKAGASGSTAFNDRLTASYIHHAMRTWSAADAVFGTGRVIPIVGVQTDFRDFMASWIHQRDTTNTLYAGAPALTPVNARGKLAFTMYFNLYSLGTTIKQHLINDIGSASNATILGLWQAHVDDIKTNQLLFSINDYRARGVTCGITTYEANCHDFYDKHNTGVGQAQNFVCTANTGNNTLQFTADGTGWIANGDRLRTPNEGAVAGLTFPYDFYVRKTGTNEVRCYATLGAYTADSGNTGAGAATVIAGTWNATSQTRFERWADKLSAVEKSTTFADIYTYAAAALKDSIINADAFALFAYSSGSDKDGTGRFSYSFDGQNPGVYAALTPALTYLAGLTGNASYWPGATINAASASYADVLAAVAAAVPGDTVVVPATAGQSWAGDITISGIQLRGAGSTTGGTVITGGQVIVQKHATYHTRFTGLRFSGNSQHFAVAGLDASKPFFIDNCYFFNAGSTLGIAYCLGGVFSNCAFDCPGYTGADVLQVFSSNDQTAWESAHTMGTADTDGVRNVYFEDCTFDGFLAAAIDVDQGARVTVRHCTFTDSCIVVHGGNAGVNDTSVRGGHHLEVYDSSFVRVTNTFGIVAWVWLRGATMIFANNVVAEASSPDGFSYNNYAELRLSCGCTGSPAYPMAYQVGQSIFPADATPNNPALIFGNTGAGASSGNFISISGSSGGGITCALPGTYIQSGRDYQTSNTWGWTAYAYPHPLRSGLT